MRRLIASWTLLVSGLAPAADGGPGQAPEEIEARVVARVRAQLGLGGDVEFKLYASTLTLAGEALESVLVVPRVRGHKGVRCFARGEEAWCGEEAVEGVIRALGLGRAPRRLDRLEWLTLLAQGRVARCLYGADLGRLEVPVPEPARQEPSFEYPAKGGLRIRCLASDDPAKHAERAVIDVSAGGALKVGRRPTR